MSEVTLWEGLGTAAGASKYFYAYTRLFYKTEEIADNKARVYRTYAIYGPSTKLSSAGRASWGGSSMFQIGGTSVTATYGGVKYYISAKYTDSGTWYASGASIAVTSINAYYTGSSGTQYKSTLAARTISAPVLANTYTVTYNANGGTGAPATQQKIEGESLTLSSTIPELADYTFKSWSGSDGNTYEPGGTYETDADLVLTAAWKKNSSSGQWRNIDGTWHHVQKWRNVNGTPQKVQRWRNINYGTGNAPDWRRC